MAELQLYFLAEPTKENKTKQNLLYMYINAENLSLSEFNSNALNKNPRVLFCRITLNQKKYGISLCILGESALK